MVGNVDVWMEVSAVVKDMFDRQKLAGTSWDGANLKKNL